jgi:proteic killer suppression protein
VSGGNAGDRPIVTFDVSNARRYHIDDSELSLRETKKIWEGELSRRFHVDLQVIARRKLRMLHNSQSLQDLRVPPGNRLEALSGDREGQHSIRVNQQWRICFRWEGGDAHDVELVDYHGG